MSEVGRETQAASSEEEVYVTETLHATAVRVVEAHTSRYAEIDDPTERFEAYLQDAAPLFEISAVTVEHQGRQSLLTGLEYEEGMGYIALLLTAQEGAPLKAALNTTQLTLKSRHLPYRPGIKKPASQPLSTNL